MTNIIFFGWDTPHRGREHLSAEHFQDFVQYLAGLQQGNTIQTFDTVFLDPHGGGPTGFFLIRGESNKLDALVSSPTWDSHMMRAGFHLDGLRIVRGVTDKLMMERMNLWVKTIPS